MCSQRSAAERSRRGEKRGYNTSSEGEKRSGREEEKDKEGRQKWWGGGEDDVKTERDDRERWCEGGVEENGGGGVVWSEKRLRSDVQLENRLKAQNVLLRNLKESINISCGFYNRKSLHMRA